MPISNTVKNPGLLQQPKRPGIGAPFVKAAKSVGNFLANPMSHTTGGNRALATPQMTTSLIPAPTKKSSVPVATAQTNAVYSNPQPTVQATPQMTTPSGMPITGDPSTFSGNPTFQIQQPQVSRGLFPDVLSSIQRTAQITNPITDRAISQIEKLNRDLSQSRMNQIEAEGQQALAPIPKGVAFGRQANVRQQYEAQQAALSNQLAAMTDIARTGQAQQQIELGGLRDVAGFAPEATRFSAFTGGGAGNTFDPNVTAQQYAREVASGARTYDDAVSAMGLYGNAGKQFLDSAIRQVNPNFNFAQSQSFADTQGRVGPQYQFATQALQNVENALQQLGSLQKTNVPLWNQFANFASLQTGIGGEQSRAFVGAVQSLRNAYAAILATAKGGLPSDYSSQAIAEVPDIPTPNDLAAIRHNLEVLGQARLGIFGQPGGSQTGGGTVVQTSAGPVNTDW